MSVIRLALAQMNFAVGDISGNATKIKQTINKAISLEADIITFPEMAITGYPPEDLLLKPSFIQDTHWVPSRKIRPERRVGGPRSRWAGRG